MYPQFLRSAAACSEFELSESEAQPLLPRVIAGRYRIDAPLAEGGMGAVFRGWHVLLEQPIAIKFLKDEYADNPEAVARFLREARATARLQGRHVAHVFDIGRINGLTPFMVTELLAGSDLGKLLAQGAFSPERAVATLLAVCDAVLDVHAAGIVHRDLKPDNLFVVDDGSLPLVKILDFGVARPLRSDLTRPERGVGSPQYMSPEQILTPQQVDFRTDVWSLGVVLYELLTARLPFLGATVPDLCAQIVRADFVRPSNWSCLPDALTQIICKCLEKDRQARYETVAELKQALSAVWRSRPSSRAAPVQARERRATGPTLVFASVLAGMLSFAGVVVVFDRANAAPVRPRAVDSLAASTAAPAAVVAEQPLVGHSNVAIEPVAAACPAVLPVPMVEAAAPRTAGVPLRVESGEQRPHLPTHPAGWLWLERNASRGELTHQDVVSPYPTKPWAAR